jgi:hypothetical protein
MGMKKGRVGGCEVAADDIPNEGGRIRWCMHLGGSQDGATRTSQPDVCARGVLRCVEIRTSEKSAGQLGN